jgi:hypothetical protein
MHQPTRPMSLSDTEPCPACPQVLRDEHYAVRELLRVEKEGGSVTDAMAAVRLTNRRADPLVVAHDENQAHAFAPDLLEARFPKAPGQ